ncbi:MAG: outer membrane beta-barrel protein [Rubellimicrobium sp.]|nr:outer membrane beta-barrel protein [Rubellimicrobium sp.]
MLRQLLAASAAVTLAAPAMAGGLAAPAPEPVVEVPVVVPVAQPSADWSGFYAGLQGGVADVDASSTSGLAGTAGVSFSGNYYGAHAGYMHDFGRFVVGGELRYDDLSDITYSSGGSSIGGKSLVAASLRVGYDMGRILPYVSVGGGQFTAADDDKSNGVLYGIGADYALTDNWRLGAEVTHFEFNKFDASDYDVTGNAVGLRVSYAF